MGREWFLDCLSAMETSGKGWWCWDSHSTTKNRPRWAFAQHKLTSPGRSHLEWTKRGKFGRLWVVLDHWSVWKSTAGEVDVFNIIFCTQKHRLHSKYSSFHPPRRHDHLFELFKSGKEQKDGQTSSEGFEWLTGSTEKLVLCPGRKWSAEGRTIMATNGWRASVGG
jgi:hypothetical protein